MAVYERNYAPYSGPRTPAHTRFLVLPRYAFRDVIQSRLMIVYFVLCLLGPVGVALMIYLPHNLKFLENFQIDASAILSFFKYDAEFFLGWFMIPQAFFCFLLAVFVGPALVSRDLANNGLPLYLSRPFNRRDYIAGKMSVLVILLSLITWVPGMLLFLLQAYLGGRAWLADHWRVGPAILLGFWIFIAVLSVISLAISAYVKWKPVARVLLFGIFLGVSPAAALAVNLVFKTDWGALLNLQSMIEVVWYNLFGLPNLVGVPAWAAWFSLLSVCGACVLLVARKVKAYEVVR